MLWCVVSIVVCCECVVECCGVLLSVVVCCEYCGVLSEVSATS